MSQAENRILIIDDNPNIHTDIKSVLYQEHDNDVAKIRDIEATLFGCNGDDASLDSDLEYEIDSAYSGDEGIDKLLLARNMDRPYSVIFTDIRMPPGMDGIVTASKLLEVDRNVQIVICSAYSDYSWEDAVGILGRNDRWLILKKPFELIELRQMVSALCEKWHLQTHMQSRIKEKTLSLDRVNKRLASKIEELEKSYEKINYLAYFDGLTNLPNRNYFYLEAERLFSNAKAIGNYVALIYLDLDDFKHVNDTLGHSAGDELLCKVTAELQSSLRGEDIVKKFHPIVRAQSI